MERSGRDRSKKVAAVEAGLKQAAENKRRKISNPKKPDFSSLIFCPLVEAGLKQAAENKRRKIGNPKKQKKMKTATAVALLAEFPSAPVTAVLDQTTVVTPMVKTLLDYCIFLFALRFLIFLFTILKVKLLAKLVMSFSKIKSLSFDFALCLFWKESFALVVLTFVITIVTLVPVCCPANGF